jgi:periplasmic divalent cation tolerance protein
MKLIAIVTTVGSREQAQAIARLLVERRLVACAQISEIESVYRWEGRVQQEPECRLLLKTCDSHYQAVETALREAHPYQLPAIFAVAVEHAYAPYAEWVRDSLHPDAAG